AGQWTNITAARRNGVWELYVNSKSLPVTNNTTTPAAPTTGTYIGADSSGRQGFNGRIDAVRVYNQALSTDQIMAIANETSDVKLQSIEITKLPTKLNYLPGDMLIIDGLVVTGTYSDGTTKVENVTTDNITGFDNAILKSGQQLTVTLGGKSASFNVNTLDVLPGSALVPGRIEAVNYNSKDGLTLRNQSVNDGGPAWRVSYINKGDWMEYNVDVAKSGFYRVNYKVATGANTGEVEFQVDGVPQTRTLFLSDGMKSSDTVALSEGSHKIRLNVTAGYWALRWFEFTEIQEKKLNSITAPAPLSVAIGTPKTAAALGLPEKVALVTDAGNMDVSVNWDLNSASYDPTATTAQTFTVTGEVTLPIGVTNPNSVPLTTSISVSASDTFTEDFENGIVGWTVEKGTASTSSAQAHSGAKSYVKDENADAISRTFSNYLNGLVSVWYYDNMSGTTKQMASVEGGKWIAAGVDTSKTASIGSTKYQVRIDGTYTSSGVDRTKGWHKFTWDYTSGDHVDLYIDDRKVATADSKSFNKIAMGDFWGAAGIGYFDDVKIENLRKAVKGVTLSKTSMELEVGETEAIAATVTPEAAANKNVTWKSSNEAIVSVDQNGVVTANAEGTAIITVTTVNGGYTANCTVTVKKPMPKAALTGPQTVNTGQTFNLKMGLSNVTQSVYQQVYGQDLTLHYDPMSLQFNSVTSLKQGFKVIGQNETVPGQVQIVAASVGENVYAQGDMLTFNFTAKSVTQATYSSVISVDHVVIANSQGNELQVGGASREIQISIPVDKSLLTALIANAQAKYNAAVEGNGDGLYVIGAKAQLQSAIDTANAIANDPNANQQQVDSAKSALEAAIQVFETKRINADINGGGVSIGDLAIVAGTYGKQEGESGWNELADVNKDGKVGLEDLAIVALAMFK
ncbi:carbohydrate-binding protein, partial [Paenibacillus sp. LMG 31458]